MTYRDLLCHIDNLEEEQLDMIIMIDIDDEFYPAEDFKVYENTDRLEDGHPYIILT